MPPVPSPEQHAGIAPPDRLSGRRLSSSTSSPTVRNRSSSVLVLSSVSPSAMTWRTVYLGSNEESASWKSRPTLRRSSRICLGERPHTSASLMRTAPVSGRSNAASTPTKVDLPEPLGPTMAIASPRRISRSTSSRATVCLPCPCRSRRTAEQRNATGDEEAEAVECCSSLGRANERAHA